MLSGTDTKELQRKAGVAARKAIPREEAMRLSKEICNRIRESRAWQDARAVLSYCAFGGEVDVGCLNGCAELDGKLLALPICYDEGRMAAAAPTNPGAMKAGRYGITAPVEAQSRILSPSLIDLVIVPCTAFDWKSLRRMGMGAGYYDRYLPQCVNAVFIAAAFEVQHIPGLRADEWDIPMNAIATEKNWYEL